METENKKAEHGNDVPSDEDIKISEDLLKFIEKSPTAFHTASNIRAELIKAGYEELVEGKSWKLEKSGRYFVVRNESSVIAFRVPEADFGGFMIAAAHGDSPAFKVKENPEIGASGAYTKLNVEKYGGMLISPWFDRSLSIAGRLVVREGNRFTTRLVNVDRDLCMIPSLAIHMDRTANSGKEYNVQKDLLPIIGSGACEGTFMDIIAEAAGTEKENIAGNDLFLYSRTPGSIWGARREYISSGHLDDLQCAYGLARGFLEAGENQRAVPVLAIFDNEEVGSGTKQGADSTFLNDVLARIVTGLGLNREDIYEKTASSFMVSADNAHAVHPNVPEKADPVNQPRINEGIVIKYNANQKYTTDAVSKAVFRRILEKAGVPSQDFTNRSDEAGGSTLGNISNVHVSLNTVDIGLPQLAMHSPYETAGVKDTAYLIKAMKVFFSASLEDTGQGSYTLEFNE